MQRRKRAQVGAAAEEDLQTLAGELDFMRHAEADERQRDSAVNDLPRGVGIGKEIELGGRGYVAAFPNGAAHGHDVPERTKSLRILVESNCRVGQRSDCYEGDFTRELAGQRHDGFRSRQVAEQVMVRRGPDPSARPVVTVHVGGEYRRCDQWSRAAPHPHHGVADSTGTFPCTVVMPSTRASGHARASSTPPSVSMTIRRTSGLFRRSDGSFRGCRRRGRGPIRERASVGHRDRYEDAARLSALLRVALDRDFIARLHD